MLKKYKIITLTAVIAMLLYLSYQKGYADCDESYIDWLDENIMLKNRVQTLSDMLKQSDD